MYHKSGNEWFISDTHFFHANIIQYANRPFHTVEEMNEMLIENWNSRVKDSDTVYHLGDVGFGSVEVLVPVLKRLKGRKILIYGNHDRRLKKNSRFTEQFAAIHESPITIQVKNGTALLGHVPKQSVKATYQIYGHIHNNLIRLAKAFNASVEVNDYRPVTFDELAQNNQAFLEKYAGTSHIASERDYFSGLWDEARKNPSK